MIKKRSVRLLALLIAIVFSFVSANYMFTLAQPKYIEPVWVRQPWEG